MEITRLCIVIEKRKFVTQRTEKVDSGSRFRSVTVAAGDQAVVEEFQARRGRIPDSPD